MLHKLLGFFLIIFGGIWSIKPTLLQRFIQKKSLKKIRRILFWLLLFFGAYCVSIAISLKGLVSKFGVFLLGIFIIIRGFSFLKAKISEKVVQKLSAVPLSRFRIFACLLLCMGVVLFKMN